MLSFTSDMFKFLVGCLILNRMCVADINEFFPEIKGDLRQVTWAHAVNNASYLNSTLNNNGIMMIEADVLLGTISGTSNAIPIMCHPPNNTSDLSLEQFMERISNFNNEVNSSSNSNSTRKGVKLDFKSIDAYLASSAIIDEYNKGSYPLWINADILAGPTNATSVPVNASLFLSQKLHNETVLSLGWTTNMINNSEYDRYNDTHIEEMVDTIQKNNVTNVVTFAVRAALAANSLPQMKTLLSNVSSSTLTIWMSDETDNVNVANLRTLISDVGYNRTYLDLPENLRRDVLRNGGNSRLAMSAVISLVITGLIVMFS